MNAYSQLLIYLKGLAEADEFINTVTNSDGDDIDLFKGNIYPLCNIFIEGASFGTGQMITFDVQIACVSGRDINKEIISDKFWKQDNEVDNLNEMLASLNKMYVKMLKDFEDTNIRLEPSATLDPLKEWNKNLLDGWLMTFTIEMPNTTLNICV